MTIYRIGMQFIVLIVFIALPDSGIVAQVINFTSAEYSIHEIKYYEDTSTPNSWIRIREDGISPSYIGNINNTIAYSETGDINPIAYVSGSKARLKVTVKISCDLVQDDDQFELFSTAVSDNKFFIDGYHLLTYIPNSDNLYETEILSFEEVFASGVVLGWEDFKIEYSLRKSSNQATIDLGEIGHPLFVTKNAPFPEFGKYYHFYTLLEISCVASHGFSLNESIIEVIWLKMKQLDTQRSNDNVMLSYYALWFTSCSWVSVDELLEYEDGQCGAWAKFLIELLKIQGINYGQSANNYVIVKPKLNFWSFWRYAPQGFLIKNYSNSGVGMYNFMFKNYPNVITFSSLDYVDDNGFKNISYSETSDLNGMPGQNSNDPQSFFENHQFTKLNDRYLDPAYGVEYSSVQSFESQAVHAYYIAVPLIEMDETVVNIDLNDDGVVSSSATIPLAIFFRTDMSGVYPSASFFTY